MSAKYLYIRKIQAISLVILGLIFMILSMQTLGRAYREGGYDFTSYLLSSQAFWNGENPYLTHSPYPYIYPLFLAVVLIPFVYLPPVLPDSIFLVVNIFLLSYSFIYIIKYYGPDKLLISALAVPSLILTVFFLAVIQNNLLNGQINIVVLFSTILFLIFYLKQKLIEASIFLSLGIAFKLTPLIFLFFLLKRKEYKMIALSLLFSFIFIFGIPYLIQGNNTLDAYQVYFQRLNDLSFAESLQEKLKIFTLNDLLTEFISGLKGITWFKVFSAAVVILILFFLDKGKSIRGNSKELLIFSIYSAAILLISPMSETHHMIVILPALSIITYLIFFDYKLFNKTRIFLLISFVLTFLISTLLKAALFYFISFVILISLIYLFYKPDYER